MRLLQFFCPQTLYEEIEGDLLEKFQADILKLGESTARRKLAWNVIRFFRPGIVLRNKFSVTINYLPMFRNYFRVALRSGLRNKTFSAINIIGLATGITSVILMMLWVQNELGYDRFHHDSDRLYEAWNRDTFDGRIECWSTTPRILASTLKEEYPEVEQAISYADYQMEFLVSKGDKKFTDNSGIITETAFLSMFNFPMLSGDPSTALNDPFSIVLTNGFAKKLFDDEPAQGKSITLRYGTEELNFMVTGVLKELPNNTAFDFGYLLSWELMRAMGEEDKYWGNNSVMTFVKLRAGVSLEQFNSKMKDIVRLHTEGQQHNEMFLYPVADLRLYSTFVNGIPEGGRIEIVRLFGVIAVFIIMISCINFMNLTTARCELRAKEVGVRKAVGAHQKSLVGQFLTESLLVSACAGCIAISAVYFLLPLFNTVTEKQLTLNFSDTQLWVAFIGLVIVAGLLAGSYPAFFLSSFRPVRVLKGNYLSMRSGSTVRKALVIFQFTITFVLIIATLVVNQQIEFAQHRESGFSKDKLIYHSMTGDLERNFTALKKELLETGAAASISKTYSPITQMWSNTPGIQWQGKDPNLTVVFDRYAADEHIVATAGLNLVAGRDLDVTRFPWDSSSAIINESAANVMGFKNPIGEQFIDGGKKWAIIGVVEDFVARSPFHKISPMVILGAGNSYFYSVHVRLSNAIPLTQAIALTEKSFKKYNPDFPFEHHFADVEYERKFHDEKQTQKLAGVSGSLAILISCLGILGLSIHIANKRVKEIGIRKVFGASIATVLVLLSKEPVKLICISLFIASPFAYWAMQKWLENYDYKISIGWTVFLLAGAGMLVIALVTISIQTIRAAVMNPAKTLKHE